MTCPALHQHTAPVVEQVRLARDTYRLRFNAPALAAAIQPGQFLMLRLPHRTDPLLGRAFALYDTAGEAVDIVYFVIGKMTKLMAQLRAGDAVEVWGPLGQPFPSYAGYEQLVTVGGGIGQTPMLALLKRALGTKGYGGQPAAREVAKASFYYGVRTAELLAGLEDFRATGAEIHLATDDGSTGFKGYVPQLVEEHHRADTPPTPPCKGGDGNPKQRWVGCGPEPMMHALARVAAKLGVPLDLSLETPMACGVGICFSCVTKVKTDSGWDYRRVCVEGPVFAAEELVW
jgi:dihydroorotate dehydrogenase electron transfer subunit